MTRLVDVLFLCKRREGYAGEYAWQSSGLKNSAQMCADMLTDNGVPAKLIEVTDNNDIDREVTLYRPRAVIIEALWVVPEKFEVLRKLHPGVTWVVRIHSELPFLATEGIAAEWILGYVQQENVVIAANSSELYDQLQTMVPDRRTRIYYLPNYYPIVDIGITFREDSVLHVGCFGALRPLKNQFIQAVAAIRHAATYEKQLVFHINGNRVEQGGNTVLENLRALFRGTRNHLCEHDWMPRDLFLRVLGAMSVSMCVSLSETFCIVAADSVTVGVPLLCSRRVPWATERATADPNRVESMCYGLERVLRSRSGTAIHKTNVAHLQDAMRIARTYWLRAFAFGVEEQTK